METDVTGCSSPAGGAGTELEPALAPLRPGELERSCLDTAHAAEVLGWRAQVDLDGGLEATYRALTQAFEAEAASASPGAG